MPDLLTESLSIVRVPEFAPQMNLEQRLLSRVVVATRALASDGMVIEPDGIDISRYLQNPIVTAGHDPETGALGEVVGRAVELARESTGLVAGVQFAETEAGQEYAYLYGLNPKQEVYMRAWSIHGTVLTQLGMSFAQAKEYLGDMWDQAQADTLRQRGLTSIALVDAFLMKSFAAVALGADRQALSRAAAEGVRTAARIGIGMDLAHARAEVDTLRGILAAREIFDLARQIKALGRDEASAATLGNSDALLSEIRQLTRTVRADRQAED